MPSTTHPSASANVSSRSMAGWRPDSPMKDRWRTGNQHRHGAEYPGSEQHQQQRRTATDPHLAARGRFPDGDFASRAARHREPSPDRYSDYSRRASLSPSLSPRYSRPRFQGSAYPSRESTPARFTKRRRTRSPSPSAWDRRPVARRPASRSPSRERYDSRDPRSGGRPDYSPPRFDHPRLDRGPPRGPATDIDAYARDRRRSPSPPPPRRFPPRDSPPRRDYTPSPNRSGPSPSYSRRTYSRSPSPLPGPDRGFMEGPYPARGHHGNTYMMRGRGRGRGYRDRGGYPQGRGASRGGGHPPSYDTPNTSHPTSPNPHSQSGPRGGWHGQASYDRPPRNDSSAPYRQNSYSSSQSHPQDEYYHQNRTLQNSHSRPYGQPHRGYRGNRGYNRGGQYNSQQYGPDRRFPNSDYPEPSYQNGRGGLHSNLQWRGPGPARGGRPPRASTGPNSIATSPTLSHKDSRDDFNASVDKRPPPPQHDTASSHQEDEPRDREHDAEPEHDNSNSNNNNTDLQRKDGKFSFAFKSKQPPPSPAKAPADLDMKAKTQSAAVSPSFERKPPSQPKNSFPERRQSRFDQQERKPKTQLHHAPPTGPAADEHMSHKYPPRHYNDRTRHPPPTSPRKHRSPSPQPPPAKKMKHDPHPSAVAVKRGPIKPAGPLKLNPEHLSSTSVYYRLPGNESVIGAGTYGKVFRATHIYTHRNVALKKIRMEGEKDGYPITAVREIKLLQVLRHPHVVELQEVMVERNECFMVFEYMSHDLTGLINHPTFRLTPAHKKHLGRQIFEGLEFLHRRGVMHRDIKAANLLISSNGILKYADFGLARFYTKSRKLDYTNRVITIWYRPPELLLGETQYGPAVDVWSAACVFMEMFTRKAIFPGEGGELSQLEKVYNVLGTPSRSEWPGIADLPWYELMHSAAHPQPANEKHRRQFEKLYADVLSPAALDLVKQIFSYDPAQRPTAEEVLNHDYFLEEEPAPQQCLELEEVGGDWHEYESKAHRRGEEKKRKEEYIKEKERRKVEERRNGKSTDSGPGSVSKDSARIEEAPTPPADERAETSDPEGSALMSMS